MNTHIIDGKQIASKLNKQTQRSITEMTKDGIAPPKLSIIMVGDNPVSEIYVRNKVIAAKEVGLETEIIRFPASTTTKTLVAQIHKLNYFESITGIIVQLPLPKHIDKNEIILAIDPKKDVDGFHPINVGRLYCGSSDMLMPCTALGCLELLKTTKIDLSGKRAVVVGRSNIVGRPVASLLLQHDATVTIAHSHTKDLKKITRDAEIVITAMGRAKFLTKEYFNSEAIVIDVGISRISTDANINIAGDVDFDDVLGFVKAITPVPGGVGPMTIACLLANCVAAGKSRLQI